MPIEIDGRKYYRTLEACAEIGIGRATLYRWLKAGVLAKRLKDRRGWGLFSEEDVSMIRAEAKRIEVEYIPTTKKRDGASPSVREGLL